PLPAEGLAYIASIAALFRTSIDRLQQAPERLRQLFEYSAEAALEDSVIRAELATGHARQVCEALADELERSPRLIDKAAFRGLADRVKVRTGQKGRALFHPIRVVLTGAGDGPELDLLVPAIERGAELPQSAGLIPIAGARERARAF